MGDVPSATPILDRLLLNSQLVQMTGKSNRLHGPHREQPESGSAAKEGQAEPPDETN